MARLSMDRGAVRQPMLPAFSEGDHVVCLVRAKTTTDVTDSSISGQDDPALLRTEGPTRAPAVPPAHQIFVAQST
jgi:hypothetical protein